MGRVLPWIRVPDVTEGMSLHLLLGGSYSFSQRQWGYTNSGRPQPWILRRYAAWLLGHEQGCPAVCRCRPTVRGALVVITLIARIVDASGK